MQSLKTEGIRSRKGQILPRGALDGMLSNPIYIGKIRHKDAIHDGQHQAIIPPELWDAVQAKLADNRIGNKTRVHKTEACPLANKLFDAAGERLVPVHAVKKGRRYRYYISESLKTSIRRDAPDGWRVPGQEIEQVVTNAVVNMLHDSNTLTTTLQNAGIAAHEIPAIFTAAKQISTDSIAETIARFVQRVELRADGIRVTLTLASLLREEKIMETHTQSEKATVPIVTRDIPVQMKRRGVEMRLVVGGDATPTNIDPTLIKNIARARKWFEEMLSSNTKSLTDIATREGVNLGDVSRLLHLAFLAPPVVEAIVAGKHPAHLCSQTLVRGGALPLSWKEQQYLLGCA